MDISGPAFCILKDGKPFNKYEVVATDRNAKGITATAYYFDSKEDAELYLRFLLQKEGEKSINAFLHSERTPLWEKREYREFKESIDWNEIPAKVKNIKFTKQITFTKIKAKK